MTQNTAAAMADIARRLRFSRTTRYRTIARTLPYVYRHAIRKSFRKSGSARSSTIELYQPEFARFVHDLYCAMFLRGYRQSTGYPVDRSTGLLAVLYVVFIYLFDDEFEVRRRRGESTDAETIIAADGVHQVWDVIGGYLRATGRDDEIRWYIKEVLTSADFDSYKQNTQEALARNGFDATRRVVEFDSGTILGTMYNLIRIFNKHSHHEQCADEFKNLGMAGKFLDDMADYADDVEHMNPNLLDALAAERPSDFALARSALAAGEPITLRWWQANCPVTFADYFRRTFDYYYRVSAPALRLPLDIYLMLLGTRRFWTVSTVRASRRPD